MVAPIRPALAANVLPISVMLVLSFPSTEALTFLSNVFPPIQVLFNIHAYHNAQISDGFIDGCESEVKVMGWGGLSW